MTTKQYYFISGLPRSGSTLLKTILNQNPNFYANISNPLARFVRSIIIESYNGPGYHLECTENKRIQLIKNLISTYHADTLQSVCFNTNRGWTSLLPLLEKTCENTKVICCVRDINWILDSFEVLFRNNPFKMSKLYSDQEAETVYTRSYALMSPGHTLRFAYDSLKEALTGSQKHMIMILEYEQLTKNPHQTMMALYNFIGQPYFEHDFNNLESDYSEYDEDAGITGLHTIRKTLEYIPRSPILPPDIWNEFSNLEVWR